MCEALDTSTSCCLPLLLPARLLPCPPPAHPLLALLPSCLPLSLHLPQSQLQELVPELDGSGATYSLEADSSDVSGEALPYMQIVLEGRLF